MSVYVLVGAFAGRLIKLLFATKWRHTLEIVEDIRRNALHIVYVMYLFFVC